jgi:hypothetical protein
MANTLKVKYYVYDPNARHELGGVDIKEEDVTGNKYVMMTSEQAQYWESMLAVGRKPFDQVPTAQQDNMNIMWGGKLKGPQGMVMAQQQHGGGPEAFAQAQANPQPTQQSAAPKRSVKPRAAPSEA